MLEIIQGLNSGAALVLVVLVFSNPNGFNTKGNIFLGLFMFALFIQLFDELLFVHKIYIDYPYLGSLFILILLLMPILLYKSILYYIHPNKYVSFKDSVYFLLPIGYLLTLILFIFVKGELKILNRDIQEGYVMNFYTAIFLLFLIELVVFWIKGQKLLKTHKENTRAYSASNEDVDLIWLQNFHYIYLVMIVTWIATMFYFASWMILSANVIFLIGMFLIAYNSNRQIQIYSNDQVEEQQIIEFLNTKEVKPKEVSNSLKAELLSLFNSEKPYLDNELNLAKLAKILGSTTHQVSALINNSFNKNFSNFINTYRIEEAKQILLDAENQHYTMLQVAYEAGFNSKTVFNTCFKNTMGISPSAFKKEHLQAKND